MPNVLLDGKELPMMDLISAAKAEGYFDPDGHYFISVATLFLITKGHRIEEAKTKEASHARIQ